jgi:hypothetical protein
MTVLLVSQLNELALFRLADLIQPILSHYMPLFGPALGLFSPVAGVVPSEVLLIFTFLGMRGVPLRPIGAAGLPEVFIHLLLLGLGLIGCLGPALPAAWWQ